MLNSVEQSPSRALRLLLWRLRRETLFVIFFCAPSFISHPLLFLRSCPDFTTSVVLGSALITDCKCVAGYVGADGAACTPSPSGHYQKFKESGKVSESVLCPVNTNTTGEGAASIVECVCVAGYQGGITKTGGKCVPGPRGMFKSDLGSFPCQDCEDNTKTHTDNVGSKSADDCVADKLCAANAWCVDEE